MRRGRPIVIAGPSGVGKGSLVERLLARDPEHLVYSVSVKTRTPRPGETHGREYFFVADAEFDRMIDAGELLEWAPFTDHRSGTPRAFVQDAIAQGRDVILELDVEGARQVRERLDDPLLIFIRPPSFEVLEARLRGRGTEDEERIQRRLAVAELEIARSDGFDHVVVNDDLERATDELAAIIDRSRTR